MNVDPTAIAAEPTQHDIIDVAETTCCIVGGGPAGVVLSLLLARGGIPVMLLETHKDFDRDFRGDTIHPSTMEMPMDVLWFRLPRKPEDGEGGMGRFGRGRIVVMLNRGDEWQIAYVISKGGYQQLRAAGLEALQKSVVEIVPELSDRISSLQDWSQVAFLSVESNRLPRWYRPGLLLIGDAAHVMSPVGGVGINYAVQDAVVAANILSEPLKRGGLHLWDLAAVQQQREWPTRMIQAFQSLVQQQILARALDPDRSLTPPAFLRLPILRDLPARIIGLGICPVRVQTG